VKIRATVREFVGGAEVGFSPRIAVDNSPILRVCSRTLAPFVFNESLDYLDWMRFVVGIAEDFQAKGTIAAGSKLLEIDWLGIGSLRRDYVKAFGLFESNTAAANHNASSA